MVCRIKYHHVLRALLRGKCDNIFDKIAMWVDEAHAMALQDELEDEIAQERGLPGARLADDVGVVASISQVEAKRLLAAPDMPHADVKIVFVHGCVHAAQASRRSRKEHE